MTKKKELLFSEGRNPIFSRYQGQLNGEETHLKSQGENTILNKCYETKKIITISSEQEYLIIIPILLSNHEIAGGIIIQLEVSSNILSNKDVLIEEKDLDIGLQELFKVGVICHNHYEVITWLVKLAKHFFEILSKFDKQQKELKLMKKRVSEVENQLAQFEIRSLENQIKPHFLFNTLNLVARLIYLGKSDESMEVVYALSKLLRYSIEKKELVRVRDELQYIKSYLFIQKSRYGEQLNFQIDVSQNTLGGLIPALSIQPLVENSIKHGLEPKGAGLIKIIGRLKRQKLFLTVKDDGVGFKNNGDSLQKNNKSKRSFGTGLKNIEKRIRFYFGDDYDLIIKSKPDEGTEITIIVPFVSDLEDDYIPVFWFDK